MSDRLLHRRPPVIGSLSHGVKARLVIAHLHHAALYAIGEGGSGPALELLHHALAGGRIHRVGVLGVGGLGGLAADLVELRTARAALVQLARLPEVRHELGVVNLPRGEAERLGVAVDADGLKSAVLLLVVVDALNRLRDGAEAHRGAEVVLGKDAVVARPLRGASGLLVHHDDGGGVHRHGAPPVNRFRPADGFLQEGHAVLLLGLTPSLGDVSHHVKAL